MVALFWAERTTPSGLEENETGNGESNSGAH
jgi:hypothetical protein